MDQSLPIKEYLICNFMCLQWDNSANIEEVIGGWLCLMNRRVVNNNFDFNARKIARIR